MTEPSDRRVDLDEIDPDDLSSNPSPAASFADVVEARLSRRNVLQCGALVAAGFLITRLGQSTPAYGAPASPGGLLGFSPVPLAKGVDDVVVPAGYRAAPFLPWGTPLHPNGAGSCRARRRWCPRPA